MLDYDEEKFRKREACDYANRPLDEITDSCTVRSADTLTVARGERGRQRGREKKKTEDRCDVCEIRSSIVKKLSSGVLTT